LPIFKTIIIYGKVLIHSEIFLLTIFASKEKVFAFNIIITEKLIFISYTINNFPI